MNAQRHDFYRAGTGGISLTDRFAAELAETGEMSDEGSIELASIAIRVSTDIGHALFKQICRKLGRQAR